MRRSKHNFDPVDIYVKSDKRDVRAKKRRMKERITIIIIAFRESDMVICTLRVLKNILGTQPEYSDEEWNTVAQDQKISAA